jgi:hypothetical protein
MVGGPNLPVATIFVYLSACYNILKSGNQYIFQEEGMDKRGYGASGGVIWFIGWLFTISFANLVWWKIILGLVVWPLFLGQALR